MTSAKDKIIDSKMMLAGVQRDRWEGKMSRGKHRGFLGQ